MKELFYTFLIEKETKMAMLKLTSSMLRLFNLPINIHIEREFGVVVKASARRW